MKNSGLVLLFLSAFWGGSPAWSTEQSISDLLEKQGAPLSEALEEPISTQVVYTPTASLVLNVLDKITARVSEVSGTVGQTIVFGNLEIMPQACYKAPADEKPESAARLTVYDRSKGRDVIVFSGWMFASSPALSALEHPIYDISVKECTGLELNPS